MQPYIELNFTPNDKLVSVVRRFVADFYTQLIGDNDAMSRVALATHELLENSQKYSLDGQTHLRLEVDNSKMPSMIHIQIRNRADPRNLAALVEILEGAAAAEDAMVFYCELIARTASRTDGSGLGLARVCAESEMKLAYSVDGEFVTIDGRAAIPTSGHQVPS